MKRYLGMVAGGSGTRDSFCDCAAIHDIPSAAREARELPKVWLYMQSASTAFRQGLGEWLTFTMALRGSEAPRCRSAVRGTGLLVQDGDSMLPFESEHVSRETTRRGAGGRLVFREEFHVKHHHSRSPGLARNMFHVKQIR